MRLNREFPPFKSRVETRAGLKKNVRIPINVVKHRSSRQNRMTNREYCILDRQDELFPPIVVTNILLQCFNMVPQFTFSLQASRLLPLGNVSLPPTPFAYSKLPEPGEWLVRFLAPFLVLRGSLLYPFHPKVKVTWFRAVHLILSDLDCYLSMMKLLSQGQRLGSSMMRRCLEQHRSYQERKTGTA